MSDAATTRLAKRKVTMPPSTQLGMSEQNPPRGPMRPKRMSQKAHARPAAREAQRVIAITPEFCE